MRFLADECCDFAAVVALRAQGHDVLAVSEFQSHSVDKELLDLAVADDRILLTEDKDFGWLVYAGRLHSPGVILIRFPASARKSLPETLVKFIRENSSRLSGAFIVLQPGTARVTPGR